MCQLTNCFHDASLLSPSLFTLVGVPEEGSEPVAALVEAATTTNGKGFGDKKRSTKRVTQERYEAAFIGDPRVKELITKEYPGNNKTRIYFICAAGHRTSTTWKEWTKAENVGNLHCKKCSGSAPITQERYEAAFIGDPRVKELITKEYPGSCSARIHFICPAGHRTSTTWEQWHRAANAGRAHCSKCSKSAAPTQEEYDAAFDDPRIGKLITTKYPGSCADPIYFLCPEGHLSSVTWVQWRKVRKTDRVQCKTCSNVAPPTQEEYDAQFEGQVSELITKKYPANSTSPIYYICLAGHETYTTWAYWRQGHRCSLCHAKRTYADKYTHSPYSVVFDRSSALSTIDKEALKTQIRKVVDIKAVGAMRDHTKRLARETGIPYALDHQLPLKWFDHDDLQQIGAAWSVINLRPLPAVENSRKRSKLTPKVLQRLIEEPELLAIYRKATKVPPKVRKQVEAALRSSQTVLQAA
jgi:hypothetical protein